MNQPIEIPIRLRGRLFLTREHHTPVGITLTDPGARWGRSCHGLHRDDRIEVHATMFDAAMKNEDVIVYGILCGGWHDALCWRVVAIETRDGRFGGDPGASVEGGMA